MDECKSLAMGSHPEAAAVQLAGRGLHSSTSLLNLSRFRH